MPAHQRTIEDLQEHAVMHWSKEMLEKANAVSALPILLETQDAFIALLKVASKSPQSWKTVLDESKALTPSIFLKHLMVLSDLGGEALNKLSPLSSSFDDKCIHFNWEEKQYTYRFREIGDKCPLTNSALRVDSKSVISNGLMSNRMFDVIMLLLFGALDPNNNLPEEAQQRCSIGFLLGSPENITKFVKENYIRVSKQLSGEKANSLGHASQRYVASVLKDALPKDWVIQEEGSLAGVSHTDDDGKLTNFDLVVKSPTSNEFGIEVSFQVTTNSTIERKARESQSLYRRVSEAGHHLCYVIDGAGNINVRKKAISTICRHSHCTVAMSKLEIESLAAFMIDIQNRAI
jgi:hypothetical protein